MLFAHAVPGYFAAALTEPHWRPEWTRAQRLLLWGAALVSVGAPDADVLFNVAFRGFVNHSVGWTHSIFLHGAVALVGLALRRGGRWPYLQMLVGLVAVGGLSHLLLDVVSHGTPMFAPFSMAMIGAAPARVVQDGVWAYVSDPSFLAEPLLLAPAALHAAWQRAPRYRRPAALIVGAGLVAFNSAFLVLLPLWQHAAALASGPAAAAVRGLMKIEYLADGGSDCPLIRIYDFDISGAARLRRVFEDLKPARGSRST
jgi:hypothetical protein